jgi:type II secretory pathway pseudopilin PulG
VRARLADEAGFTIVELLTAMVVGLLVLGAAFALVGRATALQSRTQDRVDAHQRGRTALEAMVTELRSGTCALTADGTSYPPIISGDGTRVAFYANTAGPNALPQRRELSYDATNHQIWEDVYQLQSPSTDSSGKKGQVVISPLPARQSHRLVLDNVYPRDTGTPIFTYWSYRLTQLTAPPNDTYEASTQLAQLPVPITTTDDAMRVVQVRMAIRVRPAGITSTSNNPLDAILVGAAFARSADPVSAANADSVTQLAGLDTSGLPIYVGQAISCS